MTRGKRLCELLKDIRCKVAAANGITYEPKECTYKGECDGTCPTCEAEVQYLEAELKKRKEEGKIVYLKHAAEKELFPFENQIQQQKDSESIERGNKDSGVVCGGITPNVEYSGSPLMGYIPSEDDEEYNNKIKQYSQEFGQLQGKPKSETEKKSKGLWGWLMDRINNSVFSDDE